MGAFTLGMWKARQAGGTQTGPGGPEGDRETRRTCGGEGGGELAEDMQIPFLKNTMTALHVTKLSGLVPASCS